MKPNQWIEVSRWLSTWCYCMLWLRYVVFGAVGSYYQVLEGNKEECLEGMFYGAHNQELDKS